MENYHLTIIIGRQFHLAPIMVWLVSAQEAAGAEADILRGIVNSVGVLLSTTEVMPGGNQSSKTRLQISYAFLAASCLFFVMPCSVGSGEFNR